MQTQEGYERRIASRGMIEVLKEQFKSMKFSSTNLFLFGIFLNLIHILSDILISNRA